MCGSTDLHSRLGNPDGASASNHTKYFSKKAQFNLSYSNNNCIANWVAWRLNSQKIGSTGRTDAFASDASLPSTIISILTSDYTGSGYDCGHQCPGAECVAG